MAPAGRGRRACVTLRARTVAVMMAALTVASWPACSNGDDDEVVVAAAASLTEVFRALEDPASAVGIEPVFSFAGSRLVVEQASQGAPIDVVAVADPALIEGGTTFARNRLVAVTNEGSDVDALRDLAEPGMRIVLAAEAVPAGSYAREALRAEGLLDAVLDNVVSNEADVKAVAAKVALGEADAGIVYTTDLRADPRLRQVGDPLSVVAEYAVTVTSDPPNPDGARRFVEFLDSAAAREVFEDFGFESVGEGAG